MILLLFCHRKTITQQNVKPKKKKKRTGTKLHKKIFVYLHLPALNINSQKFVTCKYVKGEELLFL